MQFLTRFPRLRTALCGTVLALWCSGTALAADGYAVLHDFTGGRSSADPLAPLLSDGAGNFYGTATSGGNGGCQRYLSAGCGTVYELTPTRRPGSQLKETVLYRFRGGKRPWFPIAGLTPGPAGSLYGMTTDTLDGAYYDCVPGDYCGTAFQLTPPSQPGGAWNETDLFRFDPSTDGAPSFSGLVPDAKGNLYGTTCTGGPNLRGTVFELSPPPLGRGWWTKTILYSFPPGGNCPSGNVVFDNVGNLYGTTFFDGPQDLGLVYMLSPPPRGSGAWAETVLYQFGSNTCYPQTNLLIDASGNLYGTTRGCPQLPGAVFELSPPVPPSTSWNETLLVAFFGSNDDSPTAQLAFDSAGNLYGTTANGGAFGRGALFQLKNGSIGAKAGASGWTETVLHSFSRGSGYSPGAGPTLGPDGALYGTTWEGGDRSVACKKVGCGVVFRFAL